MKTFLPFVFTVVLFWSCGENDLNKRTLNACGVNSIDELPWLKAQVDSLNQNSKDYDAYVYQATYLSKTVFFTEICCPACRTMPPMVTSCSGESLGRLGFDIDDTLIKGQKIIWKTNNKVCS